MSLRRTGADWPIVAAAWVVTLLASVLLAAGPIYADSASEAGLRRTLSDASVVDANVQVSTYVAPADAARVDDRAHGELQFAIAPVGGAIVRDWRASATLAIPPREGAEDVVKIYKVADLEVVALQGLDQLVEPGELIALVGASGSGKSTLMGRRERTAYRRRVIGLWQQTARNLLRRA